MRRTNGSSLRLGLGRKSGGPRQLNPGSSGVSTPATPSLSESHLCSPHRWKRRRVFERAGGLASGCPLRAGHCASPALRLARGECFRQAFGSPSLNRVKSSAKHGRVDHRAGSLGIVAIPCRTWDNADGLIRVRAGASAFSSPLPRASAAVSTRLEAPSPGSHRHRREAWSLGVEDERDRDNACVAVFWLRRPGCPRLTLG
jgi:hypothetical protein